MIFDLTEKQKKAFNFLTDHETEFVGYGGAAGGGKTALGCYYLMQIGYYAAGSKWFIGRDRLKDTRASVLKTWGKISKQIGFDAEWTYVDNRIRFKNGTDVDFIDLTFLPVKDPMFERYGSTEYTGGWIEEAGQVHYMAFEVLKTRIGRWLNQELNIKKKIFVTFNPKKNWVDTTFYRPYKKGEEQKDTKFVFALPTDNPYLPPDYIETLKNLKDEATKQRLLYGNFDYDNDPTSLIQYDQIEAIYTNDHVKEDENKKYIICDVARYGSDRAILTVWKGFVLIEYLSFDTSATTQIEQAITALRAKYQIRAKNVIVDEDGVGGGVVDHTRARGFVNNSQAHNKNYANLKNECGYKLAELIDGIYIKVDLSQSEREKINQELAQLKTYDADKDSKLRLLPKEKIKENIGRSPDWLDVFIMRMYPELKPKGAVMSFDVI